MSKLVLSLRHISEVFLYEYYCLGDDEYEISDEDRLTPHKIKAKELLLVADYSKAQQEWLSAHLENPVDMESILRIIFCCKQLGDPEGEYSYTKESYNYCCTRAELAAYYRNLGWYYLEKYRPEVAATCYLYSKYFEDSRQAEAELEFLEKAIGKKVADKDLDQIQKILKENDIPTEADPVTLALLYKAAQEADEAGDIQKAFDCYRMVYDLTNKEFSTVYRTRQYRISKNHILYDYCRDICRSSAVLYNRANFILRQYSSSVDSMAEFKPLFPNQMMVYRLVRDNLSGTKYLGDSKWLSYNGLDYLLKVTRDKAYYALPAQANQQILKLLLRDYKSFFEAVKACTSV